MGQFSDTIINRVDAKGRVSLPARFRQVLAGQGSDHVILIRGDGIEALEGFGPALRQEIDRRLAPLDYFSEDYDALAAKFFADSVELPWDSEGRIKIPDHFASHARLGEQIAFVGFGRKFQIWEPQAYERHRQHLRTVGQRSRGTLTGGSGAGGGQS